MAKLNCKCGHTTSLSGDSPNQFFLISSPQITEMEENLDSNNLNADDMNTYIVDNTYEVYRCENCKRLYIDDVENGKHVILVYGIEEILRSKEDEEE